MAMHDGIEQDLFPAPLDHRNQVLVREPFRDLRIHRDGADEFRDRGVERLLLARTAPPFFPWRAR